LGNVIVYGCLVRSVAMTLRRFVLLKVSRLVRVIKSNFALGLSI